MYFTEDKKKKAVQELKLMLECGEQAGIGHAMFIGFGLLLGIVREKDFIPHDNDMDMCINSDLITADQEFKYYKNLKEKRLFLAREKKTFRWDPNGFRISSVLPGNSNEPCRFTWFSLRMREGHPKCCNWFWFKWNGYYWHSKGHKWVTPRKFDKEKYGYRIGDAAIMKGIPESYLSDFAEVDFHGLKVQIPAKYGSCLDFWYPGWWLPKTGGASSKKIIAVIDTWKSRKKWKVSII